MSFPHDKFLLLSIKLSSLEFISTLTFLRAQLNILAQFSRNIPSVTNVLRILQKKFSSEVPDGTLPYHSQRLSHLISMWFCVVYGRHQRSPNICSLRSLVIQQTTTPSLRVIKFTILGKSFDSKRENHHKRYSNLAYSYSNHAIFWHPNGKYKEVAINKIESVV